MQVINADKEVQKNIAPFLKHRVLRAIVESLASSPNNDFEVWAQNRMVIDSLKAAQRLLDSGHVKEEEMETALLAHITQNMQVSTNCCSGLQTIDHSTCAQSTCTSIMLMHYLNCLQVDAGQPAITNTSAASIVKMSSQQLVMTLNQHVSSPFYSSSPYFTQSLCIRLCDQAARATCSAYFFGSQCQLLRIVKRQKGYRQHHIHTFTLSQ